MITKNILNDFALNVNTIKINNEIKDDDYFKNEFIKFVSSQNEDEDTFNKYIPNIHKSAVRWIIENKFEGNKEEYFKSIPLFFKHFNREMKQICDSLLFSDNLKKKRKEKRQKKHMILYSAQLLKIIGLNASKIATKEIVNYYKDEIQKQDDFLENYRLISASGKITKLTTNEEKQKQKIAQVLKISHCMEEIAKEKHFNFTFLTITLPSIFHPLPGNQSQKYDGKTPQEAIDKINGYWKLVRARLSNLGLKFGDNLFGIQVLECQKDTTLHLHSVIWHTDNKKMIDEIHQAILSIRKGIEEEKIIDIKLNNGKARASTYLFKYVLKTTTTYKDDFKEKDEDNINDNDTLNDNAIRNMACRHLYGIRAFNFFGLKGIITKFNFLVRHHRSYKNYLPKEIKSCFDNGDMYSFFKYYQDYFENSYIKIDNSKKLLGIIFKKGSYEKDCSILKKKDLEKENEIVFIRKYVYCVFEKKTKTQEEITNINQIDIELKINENIKISFDKVSDKQNIYDCEIEKIISSFGYIEIKDDYKEEDNINDRNRVVQLFNIFQEKHRFTAIYNINNYTEFVLEEKLNE